MYEAAATVPHKSDTQNTPITHTSFLRRVTHRAYERFCASSRAHPTHCHDPHYVKVKTTHSVLACYRTESWQSSSLLRFYAAMAKQRLAHLDDCGNYSVKNVNISAEIPRPLEMIWRKPMSYLQIEGKMGGFVAHTIQNHPTGELAVPCHGMERQRRVIGSARKLALRPRRYSSAQDCGVCPSGRYQKLKSNDGLGLL